MARNELGVILKADSDQWARNGDLAADDLSTLATPIDENIGWTSAHSSGAIDLQREVWNRLYWRMSAFAIDLNQTGVLEYHASSEQYDAGAVVNHAGALYRAVVANGTDLGNVTTPGTNANVWVDLIG